MEVETVQTGIPSPLLAVAMVVLTGQVLWVSYIWNALVDFALKCVIMLMAVKPLQSN